MRPLAVCRIMVDYEWYATREGKKFSSAVLNQKHGRVDGKLGFLEKPFFDGVHLTEYAYKVVLSGKSGVGKTSSIATLTGKHVPRNHVETAGIETSVVSWPVKLVRSSDCVLFRLHFWDAGEGCQRKFDHVVPAMKADMDAVVYVFSCLDRATFDDIPQQMSRLVGESRNVVQLALATKLDQLAMSEVTQKDMAEFERNYKIPVMRIRNVKDSDHRGTASDLSETAFLLNRLCDCLWMRDQQMAGLV